MSEIIAWVNTAPGWYGLAAGAVLCTWVWLLSVCASIGWHQAKRWFYDPS